VVEDDVVVEVTVDAVVIDWVAIEPVTHKVLLELVWQFGYHCDVVQAVGHAEPALRQFLEFEEGLASCASHAAG